MRKLVQVCFSVLKHQQPYQPQINKLPLAIDFERRHLFINHSQINHAYKPYLAHQQYHQTSDWQ